MTSKNGLIDRIVFDSEVSKRKILLIPIETIIGTPYNPASRTKAGAVMKRLVESIKKYGVIQPLVITADRDLVDGNRRLAAAKVAQLSFVECIILPNDVNKDQVFCTVNTTAEKIGGRGWLEACRSGCKAPPTDIFNQYTELFNLVGTFGIDLMIEKKLGFNLVNQCKYMRSLGVVERLDSLIITVAQRKLTNKINAINRSEIASAEKVKQLTVLLA